MRRRARRGTTRLGAGFALIGIALVAGASVWLLADDEAADAVPGAPLDAHPTTSEVAPLTVTPAAHGGLPRNPQDLRGELRLELVDAETGAPVPRVHVSLPLDEELAARFDMPAKLRADADGRLVVPWPPGLDALKLVFHPTAHTQRTTWRPPRAGEHRVPLTPRGGSLGGVVVDESWQPVPGAEVRAWTRELSMQVRWERPVHRARADGEGRFELRNLLGDRGGAGSWLISAVAPDGRAGHQVAVDVLDTEPREEPLTLVLAPRLDVTGRVVDDDGRPIELARVGAVRLASRFESWRARQPSDTPAALPPEVEYRGLFAFTDADGRFDLALSDEPWLITASRRGYHDWEDRVSSAAELDITLSTGGDLLGVVRDHEGFVVRGARVRVWDRESPEVISTRAGGSFAVHGVLEGRAWPLTVHASGHAPYRAWVSVSRHAETHHDVELERARRLRVKLVDDAGEPLTGWWLSIRDAEPLRGAPDDPWHGRAGTQIGLSTNDEGLASRGELGSRPLQITAQEPSGLEALAVAVIVPDDELHTIQVGDAAAGFARLHLQLYTNSPDTPLEGWRLSASRLLPDGRQGSRHPLGSTDAHGRSSRSLMPGRWEIHGVEQPRRRFDNREAQADTLRRTVPLIVDLRPGEQHVAIYEAVD